MKKILLTLAVLISSPVFGATLNCAFSGQNQDGGSVSKSSFQVALADSYSFLQDGVIQKSIGDYNVAVVLGNSTTSSEKAAGIKSLRITNSQTYATSRFPQFDDGSVSNFMSATLFTPGDIDGSAPFAQMTCTIQ